MSDGPSEISDNFNYALPDDDLDEIPDEELAADASTPADPEIEGTEGSDS